jgi:hypothetical protein
MKSGTCVALVLLSLLVWSCQGGKPAEGNTPPTPITEPGNTDPGVKKPGDHCFTLKEENMSIEGKLTYDPKANAEGYLRGTKVDPADGFESNFNTSFTGRLVNDTLVLEVTSDASGSRESTQEKWIWKDSTLVEGGKTLRQVPCR